MIEDYTQETDGAVTNTFGGVKFDTGKPRYDLMPPELLNAVSTILTYGAEKYNARNWEKGMAWGRVFGAIMRHLWSWWGRQDKDDETGYSHLWHAACGLAFLIAYEQRRIGDDDRASFTKASKIGPTPP
jgi:hypothetical protein